MTSEEQAAEFANQRAQAIAALAAGMTALSAELRLLRNDVAKVKLDQTQLNQQRRRDEAKFVVLGIMLVIMIGLSVINHRILTKVNCATDTTGHCKIAAAGRAQQAQAIAQIDQANAVVIVGALECVLANPQAFAANPQGAAIHDCLNRLLPNP